MNPTESQGEYPSPIGSNPLQDFNAEKRFRNSKKVLTTQKISIKQYLLILMAIHLITLIACGTTYWLERQRLQTKWQQEQELNQKSHRLYIGISRILQNNFQKIHRIHQHNLKFLNTLDTNIFHSLNLSKEKAEITSNNQKISLLTEQQIKNKSFVSGTTNNQILFKKSIFQFQTASVKYLNLTANLRKEISGNSAGNEYLLAYFSKQLQDISIDINTAYQDLLSFDKFDRNFMNVSGAENYSEMDKLFYFLISVSCILIMVTFFIFYQNIKKNIQVLNYYLKPISVGQPQENLLPIPNNEFEELFRTIIYLNLNQKRVITHIAEVFHNPVPSDFSILNEQDKLGKNVLQLTREIKQSQEQLQTLNQFVETSYELINIFKESNELEVQLSLLAEYFIQYTEAYYFLYFQPASSVSQSTMICELPAIFDFIPPPPEYFNQILENALLQTQKVIQIPVASEFSILDSIHGSILPGSILGLIFQFPETSPFMLVLAFPEHSLISSPFWEKTQQLLDNLFTDNNLNNRTQLVNQSIILPDKNNTTIEDKLQSIKKYFILLNSRGEILELSDNLEKIIDSKTALVYLQPVDCLFTIKDKLGLIEQVEWSGIIQTCNQPYQYFAAHAFRVHNANSELPNIRLQLIDITQDYTYSEIQNIQNLKKPINPPSIELLSSEIETAWIKLNKEGIIKAISDSANTILQLPIELNTTWFDYDWDSLKISKLEMQRLMISSQSFSESIQVPTLEVQERLLMYVLPANPEDFLCLFIPYPDSYFPENETISASPENNNIANDNISGNNNNCHFTISPENISDIWKFNLTLSGNIEKIHGHYFESNNFNKYSILNQSFTCLLVPETEDSILKEIVQTLSQKLTWRGWLKFKDSESEKNGYTILTPVLDKEQVIISFSGSVLITEKN